MNCIEILRPLQNPELDKIRQSVEKYREVILSNNDFSLVTRLALAKNWQVMQRSHTLLGPLQRTISKGQT